jgi:hypothetical protein
VSNVTCSRHSRSMPRLLTIACALALSTTLSYIDGGLGS